MPKAISDRVDGTSQNEFWSPYNYLRATGVSDKRP